MVFTYTHTVTHTHTHGDTHTHAPTCMPANACGENANVGIGGNGQWNRMEWKDMRACFKTRNSQKHEQHVNCTLHMCTHTQTNTLFVFHSRSFTICIKVIMKRKCAKVYTFSSFIEHTAN